MVGVHDRFADLENHVLLSPFATLKITTHRRRHTNRIERHTRRSGPRKAVGRHRNLGLDTTPFPCFARCGRRCPRATPEAVPAHTARGPLIATAVPRDDRLVTTPPPPSCARPAAAAWHHPARSGAPCSPRCRPTSPTGGRRRATPSSARSTCAASPSSSPRPRTAPASSSDSWSTRGNEDIDVAFATRVAPAAAPVSRAPPARSVTLGDGESGVELPSVTVAPGGIVQLQVTTPEAGAERRHRAGAAATAYYEDTHGRTPVGERHRLTDPSVCREPTVRDRAPVSSRSPVRRRARSAAQASNL